MNNATIGRNYAETLLTLAKREGRPEEWGTMIESIASAMQEDRTLRTFLESPKLAASRKIGILQTALGKRVPPLFLRFLETVIMKRRQIADPFCVRKVRAARWATSISPRRIDF